MQETIDQHFVPKTHLKHFANKRGKTYFIYRVKTPYKIGDKLKEFSTASLCFEKHLYTLPGATVEERMWLEHIYSDLFENEYDKLYEMLVDPKKIVLTKAQRDFAIRTVIAMYYRTTSWNNFAYKFMDDIIERGYYMTKQSGHDYFMMENRKVYIIDKTLEQLKEEHRQETKTTIALTQLRHIMKLSSIRNVADGLMITKLLSKTDEFITSDNPVECNNIKGGHLMPIDPSNTFSMPIDLKHHLTIIPQDNPDWRHIIRRSEFNHDVSLFPMLALNRGQEQNAQKYILGSEHGLRNYFQSKEDIDRETPNERVIKTRKLMEVFK